MKFSNFLFPESNSPDKDSSIIDETLAEAQLCDELGVEVLWLAEHHFDGNCAYVDPVTFAAAIAATTSRIKIGFAVAQMSLHHPVRLAEQMALLDNLSHGRMIVGLGRGTAHNIYEYIGYDIDPNEAQERLIESEQIMREVWTTDNYEHKGKYWNIKLPMLRPRPYTQPHPYIIRASSGEASMLDPARAPVPDERADQRDHAPAHGAVPPDHARSRPRRGDRTALHRRKLDLAQHFRRRHR
jgi:alkanesulfonate monooxygenase SsuD/methylene tetrahydromethanopterin reductase-like flavin-dependent oxidoreductase (luciferase family)